MIILVFILDYYKEKLLSKLFKKSQNPYFGASLGPFCPNFGKKGLSWKNRFCQFLNVPVINYRAKTRK